MPQFAALFTFPPWGKSGCENFRLFWGIAVTVCLSTVTGAAAQADGKATTLNFAVTRNGEQIGSTTLKLQRNGDQTVAETATNVQVKIAFLTVYRYEQRLTERWVGGKLTRSAP